MNCRYVSRLLVRAGLYVAPVEEGGTFVGVVHLHDLVFNV
jgi:predicted transcriptional regulator